MRSFYTKIVGVTFENPTGESRQALIEELSQKHRPPFYLQLAHQPDNPYDSKAVAVHDTEGRQLGFLSKDVGQQIYRLLSKGTPVYATATQITGGRGYFYGINLQISYAKAA